MPIYVPGKLTLRKEFVWNESVWNPSMIQTALWLDAADTGTITESGGAVSQWNDKSGNGRNFTQSTAILQPIYSNAGLNGLPAISFVSQYLIFSPFESVINNSAFSIFFAGSGELFSGSTAAVPRFYFSSTNIAYNANNIAPWPSNTSSRIAEWSFDGINQHQVFIDGSSVATATQAVTTGFVTTYQIGRAGNDDSNGFFAEYVFVPGAISTDIRQKIEGYLAHKWGLTANLPSDHPYKLVGPTP
jgi:hypothetical protein